MVVRPRFACGRSTNLRLVPLRATALPTATSPRKGHTMHEAPPSRLTITFDPEHMPRAEHSLTSEYVEVFWLPVLGPTSISILRNLGRLYTPIANSARTPYAHVPIHPFGKGIGIGSRRRLMSRVNRLSYYEIIEQTGWDTYTIAAALPTLSKYRYQRLPPHLQHIHPPLDPNAPHNSPRKRVAQYV